MKLRVFTYDLIDSKMYIIIEKQKALIIDPCVSENAMKYLHDHKVNNVMIILTHEHWDHISGVNWLRENFSECIVWCSEMCDKNIKSSIKNGSKYLKALFIDKPAEKVEEANKIKPFVCFSDVTFVGEKKLSWEGYDINLRETPGHSPGSICIFIDDKYLFTGDSLIKDTPVITRLLGGSKSEYNEFTLPFLKSLNKNVYIYPGHGESGYLRDFKYINDIV